MKIKVLWYIARNLRVVVSILDGALDGLISTSGDLMKGDSEDRATGMNLLSEAVVATRIVEEYMGESITFE